MWNCLRLYQYAGTLLSCAHCHGSTYEYTVDLKASVQCFLQEEGEICWFSVTYKYLCKAGESYLGLVRVCVHCLLLRSQWWE